MASNDMALKRLAAVSARTQDVIVIGGGIQGAGIAREARLRGLEVALFEKGDFASGTSSKTSSLIHGGLRYLEQGDLGLVHEAVCERYTLAHLAPHLVAPLPFLFPVYRDGPRKKITIQIGMLLYDLLAGSKSFGRPLFFSPEQVRQLEPGLASTGLTSASRFFDCQMDDARLCLSVLRSAQTSGAAIFNYTEVIGLIFDKGHVRGVTVKAGEHQYNIRGTVVINAAGAWSSAIGKMEEGVSGASSCQIRPTKGIHIVVPRMTDQHAVVLSSPASRRIFFVMPWRGYSLIGTTDTDYQGDLNHVIPTPEEIAFLIRETAPFFPSLTGATVFASFAGLRPLVGGDARHPWDQSRKEQLLWTPGGTLMVAGGKYTLFRKIAIRVLETVLKRHPQMRAVRRPDPEPVIYGGEGVGQEYRASQMQEAVLPAELLSHLIGAYGTDYKAVVEIARSDAALLEPLTPLGYPIRAEVVHAVQNEYARHLSDFMLRRTRLAHSPYQTDPTLIRAVVGIMGDQQGWTADERQAECDAYLHAITGGAA